MLKMRDKTIVEFNEMLASDSPTPGGGSVSALVAALGAGLGFMTGCISAGRLADDESLKELTEQARRLQYGFLELIDTDAEGFDVLKRAFSAPKNAPDRDELIEKCLISAAAAPMETARLCCRAIELSEAFARLGSDCVISDAGCGAVLCKAAMKCAVLNVYANTRLMKDRETAEKMNAEVGAMIKKYAPLADGTFDETEKNLLQNAN